MKNLLILSGAIVAGILAFSPANAGVSAVAAVKLDANAGVPVVTKAHYRRRHVRRRARRHQRRHNLYTYRRPYAQPHMRRYYRPYYQPYYGRYGYYGHRRRGVSLYFNF